MAGSLVAVSAHAADFVWRAGGTLAKYARLGWDVNVLVLSLGVRGESAELWRQGGQTAESVARVRREEATAAAGVLGCRLTFFDLADYRMTITNETLEELAGRLREFRPTIVLTHAARDAFNPDHPLVHRATLDAVTMARVPGVLPEVPTLPAPRVYAFEPHQPEASGFVPNVLIDITADFETKARAMACVPTQTYLIEYHRRLAEARALHARRNWGHADVRYAEAFETCSAIVADLLP